MGVSSDDGTTVAQASSAASSPKQEQLEADARRQAEMRQEDEDKAREDLLRKGYAPDVVEATLDVARKEREARRK